MHNTGVLAAAAGSRAKNDLFYNNNTEDFKMSEWTKIADQLPKIGQHVVVLSEDRFWNVPDGLPPMQITATGYMANYGNGNCWAIFGERSVSLDAFTHWMPLQAVD